MTAPQTGTYSFLDVTVAFSGFGGSITLSTAGVGEGGVRITMTGDKNRMNIGARGDGMHSLIASNAGRITVSLLKTAPGNAQLSQIYRGQKASSANWGANIIRIDNPTTGDTITCSGCAFIKQPDVVYASEGGMMEWAFDSTNIDEVLGNSYQSTGL